MTQSSELFWRINYARLSVNDVHESFEASLDSEGAIRTVQSSTGDRFMFVLSSKQPLLVSTMSVTASNHLNGSVVECAGTVTVTAGPSNKMESFTYILSGIRVQIIILF